MKRLKTMIMVLRETGAYRLIGAYMTFLLLCALVIWIAEPEIATYGDALQVLSAMSVHDLSLAIVTGVLASYFNRLIQLRDKDSLATLADKLNRLPDMSREELKRLSEQIKRKFDGK